MSARETKTGGKPVKVCANREGGTGAGLPANLTQTVLYFLCKCRLFKSVRCLTLAKRGRENEERRRAGRGRMQPGQQVDSTLFCRSLALSHTLPILWLSSLNRRTDEIKLSLHCIHSHWHSPANRANRQTASVTCSSLFFST